jgi:DNA-binding NarL/FixJ family response regulator
VVLDQVDSHPAPERKIEVVVAHGDRLARAGLRALLESDPEISVAGSVTDATEAVELTAQIRPDVLIVEFGLPGAGGVEVTRRLQADVHTAATHVLILGAPDKDEDVFACLRAGARGFMPADLEPDKLADGVRALAAGEVALSPDVVHRVIAEIAARPDPRAPAPERLDELTPREREVMVLVAAGLSNGEIAERLVISHATAKTHVSRTLLKLHARDRAQLVTLAYETGLVLPRQPKAACSELPGALVAA